MADQAQFRYAYPTVEFLGGGKSRDVMAVGYVSVQHGVAFEVRVPKSIYTQPGIARAVSAAPQTIIETLYGFPGVDTVEWNTTQAPSGALRDAVTIYVTSTSGDSSDTITTPIAELGPDLDSKKIAALRAKLDAVEGE